MAVLAVDAGVRALESEAGFLLVIEFGGFPTRDVVAAPALHAALTPMDVIRRMAGSAFLRRALIAIAEMTAHARHVGVLIVQRVRCLVVIEVGMAPGSRVVARAAIAAELAFVRLLFLVAVHAFRRGLPIGLPGNVTARASDAGMRIPQGEIRTIVVKLTATQFNYVRAATEMLGVAPAALRGRDAREMSVIAALRRNVRGDVLVAVQTQARLALAVAAVVAERALLLVFRMGIGELARHEQRLRVHGTTSRRPKAQQQN